MTQTLPFASTVHQERSRVPALLLSCFTATTGVSIAKDQLELLLVIQEI